MSQTNASTTRPTSVEHSAFPRVPSHGARVATSMQVTFDAALERAAAHEPEDHPRQAAHELRPAVVARKPRPDEGEALQNDALDALPATHPFAGPPASPAAAAPAAATGMPPGMAPQQVPLPVNQTGLSAQSLPGQTPIGETRQLQLSLPTDKTVLNLHLKQALPTHWQLRLSTDAATRQQLAPHVERLRDRLRERNGQHTADFDLDDSVA